MRYVKTLMLLSALVAFAAATPPTAKKPAAPQASLNSLYCGQVMVMIQSAANAKVTGVSCNHGSAPIPVASLPPIGPNEPAVVPLVQSSYGPDCTITVQGSGTNVATLQVQQNFCSLKAGQVTASVTSGSAALIGTASGSYSGNVPGVVWFTVN